MPVPPLTKHDYISISKGMNIDLLKGIALFVVLLLAQVLVLNQVHLFGCATPLLYVYAAMPFRRNYPRWAILVWCFLMGLAVDAFANTPGVASASMTFMGFIQPYVLMLFVNRDSPDDLKPSMRQLGVAKYFAYALIMTFLYCLMFFSLEDFSFFDWLHWLLSVVGSTILTLLVILVIENLRSAG